MNNDSLDKYEKERLSAQLRKIHQSMMMRIGRYIAKEDRMFDHGEPKVKAGKDYDPHKW